VRILQVNLSDARGGAERVVTTLHTAYRARGHDSRLLVGRRRLDDPATVELAGGTRTRVLAARAAWRAGVQGRIGYASRRRTARLTEGAWDVIHVHGLHGNYLPFSAVPGLARRAPVVVTLHDMLVLTGHCGHAMACERWLEGCGRCPDLHRAPRAAFDFTRSNLAHREATLGASPLLVSAPSRWLLELAGRTYLRTCERRLVENPVDVSVFFPADRSAARRALSLPSDRPMVLIPVTDADGDSYKGFDAAVRALGSLADLDILTVTFGQGGRSAHRIPMDLRPPVRQEGEMADFYAAADVVLYPSRADNSPMAILEAMASGRPVVATRVGGIPELLEDGLTGLLVEAEDDGELTAALRSLLEDRARADAMGAAAATAVRRRHALDVVVDQWLGVYSELADRRPAPANDRAAD